jgi:hypothetical protein
MQYPIYEGQGLKGFTKTPEQIEVIKKQFKFVQPEGMTVKQFMADRGIVLTKGRVTKELQDKIKKLKIAYQENVKAYEKIRNQPLDEYQLDNIEYHKRERPGMSEDYYWEIVTGNRMPRVDEAQYIRNNTQPAGSVYKTLNV